MAEPLFDAEFMQKLEHLAIIARRVRVGQVKGYRRSKKRGSSVEFADYRDYIPGDDLRYADWNIYSRLDRLLIKLFVEEEDLFMYLLLDTSESMGFGRPKKMDYAKRLAAALAYVSLSRFDRVSIWPYSGALADPLLPVRGKSQAPQVFRYLESIPYGKGTGLEMSVREFCTRNKRPGVAVIISDLMESDHNSLDASVRRLKHHGFDVFVIHLLSMEELNPLLVGEFLLIDSETGDEVPVSIDQSSLEEYRESIESYLKGLEAYALRSAVDYARASTAIPFEDLVLKYLRQGGMLQ